MKYLCPNPTCDAEVEFEPPCDPFPCPACGVMVRHVHEFHGGRGDDWDILELVPETPGEPTE